MNSATDLAAILLDIIDRNGHCPGTRCTHIAVNTPVIIRLARRFGTEGQVRRTLRKLEKAGKVEKEARRAGTSYRTARKARAARAIAAAKARA